MKSIKKYLKPLYRKILPNFDEAFKKDLADCSSILDLGCGIRSPISHSNAPLKIGVELLDRYIEESKRKNLHNQYIKGDVTKVNFEPKSFDAVILIDVLEHLKKEDGYELIKKMETWASKKIIIFTPEGFMPQKNVDNNNLQDHLSGWDVKEFKKLGFEVCGMNGLKQLRGDQAHLKFRPELLWTILSDITQQVVYYYPKFAFHLYATKDMRK